MQSHHDKVRVPEQFVNKRRSHLVLSMVRAKMHEGVVRISAVGTDQDAVLGIDNARRASEKRVVSDGVLVWRKQRFVRVQGW